MKHAFNYAAMERAYEASIGELWEKREAERDKAIERHEADICSNRHGGNAESVEAHKTIRGELWFDRERCYNMIRNQPDGMTVDEYAFMRGKTPNAVSGRFSELARDGRIVKIGRRKTRSGCSAAVWKAVQ